MRGAGKPSSLPVSPIRLTSPSFARRRRLLNEMYSVVVALVVIICDHPFILWL